MRRVIPACFITSAALALISCSATGPKPEAAAHAPASRSAAAPGDSDQDPLGANAGCYVCHITFVNETLSATHLTAKIGCVRCHGLSAKHANDENIGATKPDILIKGKEINTYCRTCHKKHDVRPEKVVARWHERSRPKPATSDDQTSAACADCHGKGPFARTTYKKHDVPPEKLMARWYKRPRSNPPLSGHPIPVTCTECHGNHKIARAEPSALP